MPRIYWEMYPEPRIHHTSVVDKGAEVGGGTRIWHFCHVMAGAKIGDFCNIGQNVYVDRNVMVGNHCKIQNNVSVYEKVTLEDYVFLGPSCVFTNVINPRAEIERKDEYRPTLVKRGATIGANATIVCGVTIGKYALVGAGAVVTSDVPDYGLVVGVPARLIDYVSRHGQRLHMDIERDGWEQTRCPQTGWMYERMGVVRCLDWPEDKPLERTL